MCGVLREASPPKKKTTAEERQTLDPRVGACRTAIECKPLVNLEA